jgi:hypothetical protein
LPDPGLTSIPDPFRQQLDRCKTVVGVGPSDGYRKYVPDSEDVGVFVGIEVGWAAQRNCLKLFAQQLGRSSMSSPTPTAMSSAVGHDLSIPDLLHLLNEKLDLERTKLREAFLPPAVSAASLESEVSPALRT